MIYFTSDEHHLDESINDYCLAPFKTKEERMDTIIRNHNEVVTEEDEIYHLGDFTLDVNDPDVLKKILDRYKKVKKRYLILGNHDDVPTLSFVIDYFDKVYFHHVIEYEGFELFLMHDPAFYQPKMQDKIGLCGHVHNLFTTLPNKKLFNVGVDVNNYSPVSIRRILTVLKVQGLYWRFD